MEERRGGKLTWRHLPSQFSSGVRWGAFFLDALVACTTRRAVEYIGKHWSHARGRWAPLRPSKTNLVFLTKPAKRHSSVAFGGTPPVDLAKVERGSPQFLRALGVRGRQRLSPFTDLPKWAHHLGLYVRAVSDGPESARSQWGASVESGDSTLLDARPSDLGEEEVQRARVPRTSAAADVDTSFWPLSACSLCGTP